MWLHDRIFDFIGVGAILSLYRSGQLNLHNLSTFEGISAVVIPIFPAILIIEAIFISVVNIKRPKAILQAYKVPVFTWWFHAGVSTFVRLNVVGAVFVLASRFSPFTVSMTWYWFGYAFVVWSLA